MGKASKKPSRPSSSVHRILTTGDPQYYNLHVQINNQTTISTLQREKGATIANTLVPTDGSWTPEQIRLALRANMKI
ncbi:hypothetical protein NUU61_004534 [Penicillium alfredii]|uniref:Uncharacterized protein n=1 Tax=Penicillium alfredii TaxID=1506179 RepID=A0A9W9FLD7_9EURO|nr:uncharacterized protein NUU61_004534 [Penicillium alfredii]KAJ5102312.1 hypothetical protein NUU61_004534 [Penicillium alfredii]